MYANSSTTDMIASPKESIRAAVQRNVPIYVLVERYVYADYETYLRNKVNRTINYAHVDSVSIFELIEDILAQPRNNPLHQFEKYSDIETWLREQWAGLFRELLNRMQSQAEIATLQAQVVQLGEFNKTLKTYLEEIMVRVAPVGESQALIRAETERLESARLDPLIEKNDVVDYVKRKFSIPTEVARVAAEDCVSLYDFFRRMATAVAKPEILDSGTRLLERWGDGVLRDFNLLRDLLRLPPVEIGLPVGPNPAAPRVAKVKRPRDDAA